MPTNLAGTKYLGLRVAGEKQMRVFQVASISADGRQITVAAAWPSGVAVPTAADAADLRWMLEDNDLFWQTPTAWQTWPGSIEGVDLTAIDFRIRVQGGALQGQVLALAVRYDVPDETEALNDIVISAAGTRLPIKKAYRSIHNVQFALQDSAGRTAITAVVADKAQAGPLIYCLNAAGQKVAGLIDALIQGVKK